MTEVSYSTPLEGGQTTKTYQTPLNYNQEENSKPSYRYFGNQDL